MSDERRMELLSRNHGDLVEWALVMESSVARLKDENERLRGELEAVTGVIQRYQPTGSPPPGNSGALAGWVLDTMRGELEAARELGKWMADFFQDEMDWHEWSCDKTHRTGLPCTCDGEKMHAAAMKLFGEATVK